MKKLTILMIAVVAIGVFALPTTLSIGAGQHQFLQAGTTAGGQTDLGRFLCTVSLNRHTQAMNRPER